ncbi:MAG TPA: TetR/AcrR family transcriptional regulator [Solirubrobacteraceae bacterium]
MSSTKERNSSGASSTRERIVETSAELFRTQGYNATGVKQIVTAAQAPFGSLYHFFPGGKEQLGAEAIVVSGALYELLIPAVFDPAPDPVTGVRDFFAGAAQHLVDTDYGDACPIATVALEVSSVSEPMREACALVFERWIEAGVRRFRDEGLGYERSRELVIGMLAALEGAFVLARASRSTEALRVAGEVVATEVGRALEAPTERAAPPRPTPRKPRLKARWPPSPSSPTGP